MREVQLPGLTSYFKKPSLKHNKSRTIDVPSKIDLAVEITPEEQSPLKRNNSLGEAHINVEIDCPEHNGPQINVEISESRVYEVKNKLGKTNLICHREKREIIGGNKRIMLNRYIGSPHNVAANQESLSKKKKKSSQFLDRIRSTTSTSLVCNRKHQKINTTFLDSSNRWKESNVTTTGSTSKSHRDTTTADTRLDGSYDLKHRDKSYPRHRTSYGKSGDSSCKGIRKEKTVQHVNKRAATFVKDLSSGNKNQIDNDVRQRNALRINENSESVCASNNANNRSAYRENNSQDRNTNFHLNIEQVRRTSFTTTLNRFLNSVRQHHNSNFADFQDMASQMTYVRANTMAIFALIYRIIPFSLIFFAKSVYDYRHKMLIFFDLFVTFCHSNSVLRREVIKHSHRNLYSLLVIFFNLIGGIIFMCNFHDDQNKLCMNVAFRILHERPASAWELLWIVGVSDLVVKLMTVVLKAVVVAMPGTVLPFQKRGRVFLFLEATSQLYRSLIPVQPWLLYLLDSYQGSEKIVGILLTCLYLIMKASDLVVKGRFWRNAFWKLKHNNDLGAQATAEQLKKADRQCPICCDEYRAPTVLRCGHVFCESCLATWFDLKQTCPLCRAQVGNGWRDGATTFFPQLY